MTVVAGPKVKQQIFLNAIDAFAPAYVRALNVIRGIKISWDQNSVPIPLRNYGAAIQKVVPELNGQDNVIQAVLAELRNRGLSNLSGPDVPFPQGMPATITNLGIDDSGILVWPSNGS